MRNHHRDFAQFQIFVFEPDVDFVIIVVVLGRVREDFADHAEPRAALARQFLRDHLTNIGTIRDLLVLCLAYIQPHGGESPPTEDCLATMAAFKVPCCWWCNLYYLYKRLDLLSQRANDDQPRDPSQTDMGTSVNFRQLFGQQHQIVDARLINHPATVATARPPYHHR